MAALELALSLVFLFPLMLGVLDFGYYFYVASNAESAANAGVRQAVLTLRQTVGATCTTGAGGVADGGARAAVVKAQAEAVATGHAYAYMNQAPLALGNTTDMSVTLTCDDNPVPTSWHISLWVDFPPALGRVPPWMPAAPGGPQQQKSATRRR